MRKMLVSLFIQGLLVSVGTGLIIGLEREFNTHQEAAHLGGTRTFPLVSILGYSTVTLAKQTAPVVLVAGIVGIFALVVLAYWVQTQKGKLGLTTALALLVTYFLGAMTAYGLLVEAVSLTVFTTTLLSLKDQFHSFVKRITEEEMFAFIKFFIIALLVMPLLPDKPFGPGGLLNAREIGWIVVIVSSISLTGYLGLKFGGMQRGILLTAFAGGLFSSTMVAWVFSQRSRETPEAAVTYSAGIVLSSSIMFVRILLLVWGFYPPLAYQLIVPCMILLVASLGVVVYLMYRHKDQPMKEDFPLGNPLDLKNALFFVVLYASVSLFMVYSGQWFGEAGLYVTGTLSGVADMDAIAISTAKLTGRSGVTVTDACNVIVMAMLANTCFKLGVSLLRGVSQLRRYTAIGFGLILLSGLGVLLVRMI